MIKTEIRGQKSEVRSQKSEVRSQKSELARRQSGGVGDQGKIEDKNAGTGNCRRRHRVE